MKKQTKVENIELAEASGGKELMLLDATKGVDLRVKKQEVLDGQKGFLPQLIMGNPKSKVYTDYSLAMKRGPEVLPLIGVPILSHFHATEYVWKTEGTKNLLIRADTNPDEFQKVKKGEDQEEAKKSEDNLLHLVYLYNEGIEGFYSFMVSGLTSKYFTLPLAESFYTEGKKVSLGLVKHDENTQVSAKGYSYLSPVKYSQFKVLEITKEDKKKIEEKYKEQEEMLRDFLAN